MPLLSIEKVKQSSTLGIWKVEESVKQLELMFPELVSGSVYTTFRHDLRKLEWLAARALMKEMNLSWELSYTEHGKPYYPEGVKISLTHSKHYVAIIIHPTHEVGIDVQEIVPKVERIKHKYCNQSELNWAKTVEDFTLIWSAKEAMFKVKERNVHFADDIRVFPPEGNTMKVIFKENEIYNAHLYHLNGYSCVFI